MLIRYAITSFYVLYLGRPEIDILLGEYGGLLDMYALLPGFSRYPKVEYIIEVQLALCSTWLAVKFNFIFTPCHDTAARQALFIALSSLKGSITQQLLNTYPYCWIEPDDHMLASDIPISWNSSSPSKFIKSGIPCLFASISSVNPAALISSYDGCRPNTSQSQ